MAQVHLAFKERNHRSSSVARNINKNRERLLSADSTSAVRAELIGDDICSALGVTMQSSSPVLALCRKLIEAGHDPLTPLEAYRGGTLAVRVKSIGQAAKLEPSPAGAGFVKRHSRLRAASPVAQMALTKHPIAASWRARVSKQGLRKPSRFASSG